jgi:hypothetical protein
MMGEGKFVDMWKSAAAICHAHIQFLLNDVAEKPPTPGMQTAKVK